MKVITINPPIQIDPVYAVVKPIMGPSVILPPGRVICLGPARPSCIEDELDQKRQGAKCAKPLQIGQEIRLDSA